MVMQEDIFPTQLVQGFDSVFGHWLNSGLESYGVSHQGFWSLHSQCGECTWGSDSEVHVPRGLAGKLGLDENQYFDEWYILGEVWLKYFPGFDPNRAGYDQHPPDISKRALLQYLASGVTVFEWAFVGDIADGTSALWYSGTYDGDYSEQVSTCGHGAPPIPTMPISGRNYSFRV